MKLQIDNIGMQYNNNMNMMSNNQIYEQLLNLSIQMINTGIQSFNTGKNMIINKDKFYGQLKIISEQINQIINEKDIQQQMMMQQQKNEPQRDNNEIKFINVTFQGGKPRNGIVVAKCGTTIEELLDKYIQKYYGNTNPKLNFVFNGISLMRNDKRKIENVFYYDEGFVMNNPNIIVIQIN